jgi:carboxypeptidase Q
MDVLQKYLSILGADKSENQVFTADIEEMGEQGVPIFDNKIRDSPDHSFYFRYHHSAGDSMSMMNPD